MKYQEYRVLIAMEDDANPLLAQAHLDSTVKEQFNKAYAVLGPDKGGPQQTGGPDPHFHGDDGTCRCENCVRSSCHMMYMQGDLDIDRWATGDEPFYKVAEA